MELREAAEHYFSVEEQLARARLDLLHELMKDFNPRFVSINFTNLRRAFDLNWKSDEPRRR